MGERNHDRQLREARARYLGALGRARAAGKAELLGPIPIDPDADWSDEHWQALLQMAATLRELVNARQEWDGLRREHRPSH